MSTVSQLLSDGHTGWMDAECSVNAVAQLVSSRILRKLI